jgi:hypothetical protein
MIKTCENEPLTKMVEALAENKNRNITACTLKMLSSMGSEAEEICWENKPVDLVETVAKVQEMRETALRYEFVLVDFTGTFQGIVFKKTTGLTKAIKDYEFLDNSYAHIYGNIKKYQESIQFVISNITNLPSRIEVTNFLSRVLVGYIKNYHPPIVKSLAKEELVLAELRKRPSNKFGYTAQEIRDFLHNSVALSEIKDVLSELLFEGRLKNGQDFAHFILPNF